MGLVGVNIVINALVDHKVVVMPAGPELVIMVGIFKCVNAIMEITDWYKVCIIVLSYRIPMLQACLLLLLNSGGDLTLTSRSWSIVRTYFVLTKNIDYEGWDMAVAEDTAG